jgi:hypothetical protein
MSPGGLVEIRGMVRRRVEDIGGHWDLDSSQRRVEAELQPPYCEMLRILLMNVVR